MSERLNTVMKHVGLHRKQWLAITLGATAVYYVLLLLGLITRFGNWPNYSVTYHWFDNVVRIFKSTPSLSDSVMIMKDEWVFEIGYMNYDFGMGISEWSLYLSPIKIFGVALSASLSAACFILLKYRPGRCARAATRSSGVMAGVGATGVALASMSMSWVVCCSTPTWIVGLSMMGLGVSTALWLEPLGTWLRLGGFFALLVACYWAAGTTIEAENSTALNENPGNEI